MNITLDGDAKVVHGQTEGAYTLKSTLPNGKQYWRQVQGSDAIWYDNEFQNWKIGPLEHLGTSMCKLKSKETNTKNPEEATTWLYVNNDDEWMPTSNIFESSGMY